VKELRSIGIQPDILVCRCDRPIPEGLKNKLAEFCDVQQNCVITAPDAGSIYEVPLIMEREGLAIQAIAQLGLENRTPNLAQWETLVQRMYTPMRTIDVALVGKYVQLSDAYLSVVEALRHAAIVTGSSLKLHWVNSEDIETKGTEVLLKDMHGIVVPGGFGIRGVDGKIDTIRYARENGIPFLGLCLGMQCAVIEWGRNVAKLEDTHSAEFLPGAKNPVINLLPEQQDVVDLGGTMRLGTYPCRLTPEFNNQYRPLFLESGYVVSGTSPNGRLVEIIELPSHPFFVACQFHPEFQSRPSTPHPLFQGFVQAAVDRAPVVKDDGVAIEV
jgi:CTP synthase